MTFEIQETESLHTIITHSKMSIIQISELLLKNIDKEISLVIRKEKQFSFDSFIQGCHAYVEIWTPKVGDESLYLICKYSNEHNKYVVAVMIGGRTGGHVPKNLSKILNFFLTLLNCAIKGTVAGKRIN